MGVRDYFNKKTSKVKSAETQDTAFNLSSPEVESVRFVEEKSKKNSRFVPVVDFASASNFARYGLAEEYYRSSFQRIYQQFPYDGTREERLRFDNESTLLDKHIFDEVYPRTNGYAILSPDGWGTMSVMTGGYGLSDSLEYISFKGGPHSASSGVTGAPLRKAFGESEYRTSPGSNIYDSDIYGTSDVKQQGRLGTRTSNLLADLSSGVTIEFWLKKDQFVTGSTEKEVIFDLWNGTVSGTDAGDSADYGRLTLEMTGSPDGTDPFLLTLQSGASGFFQQSIAASSVTTGSIADNAWKHYAVSLASASSGVDTKFYVNGGLNNSITLGSAGVGEITGSMIAYLGALQTNPSGTDPGANIAGYGKLSGSLDEFRFWKSKKSSKTIGRNWHTHVGGGTNDDIANSDLGVYFKFNEGITGVSSTDSTVLDYSGRLSNGTWTGYTSAARNTGSAMVISTAAISEYKDPIIYPHHPTVKSEMDRLIASGSDWDESNVSSLYYSYPRFMIEEEEKANTKHLKNLTQIIGTYFDDLQLQIQALPELSHQTYTSSSVKPQPHIERLLAERGFVTSELFADASLLEQFADRDEKRNFETSLAETKARIFENIYNNIVAINKSKGTENSFRNLIRCFGVDEELIKINFYADNAEFKFEENHRLKTVNKKFIDFNKKSSSAGTIFQTASAGNSNTTGVTYLSGTNRHLANTAEIEVLFPAPPKVIFDNTEYASYSDVSSSIFGFHSASADASDLTWAASSTDDYNFEVYAVRPEAGSPDAYFLIKDRKGNFSVATSLYGDVYDNQKWNFAVRIKNENYPIGAFVTGSESDNLILEFKGVNTYADSIVNEFLVTASLTAAAQYLEEPRRYYVGAHCTNFTGAVDTTTDIRVSSFRHWASYLDDKSLHAHARDSENYGAGNPSRNAYLTDASASTAYVPQIDTLVLNWDFSTVTGSDAAGEFSVDDYSSGSVALRNRYPDTAIGPLLGNQYSGQAKGFPASDSGVVSGEYIQSARQMLPEALTGLDMISIPSGKDLLLQKDAPPDEYYFTFEKNFYESISEEMLNMFGTIVEFNNLVGEPANRYRQEYKGLNILRNLFFERVQNTPDIEKYLEYYRWLDSSLSEMLLQLVPASAQMSEGILNVVESHILERNKYRSKFPTIKEVSATEGVIRGLKELTYPWERGHAPITDKQNKNSFWWNERAERSGTTITSGDANIDSRREEIRKANVYFASSSAPFVATDAGVSYESSPYKVRSLQKISDFSIRIADALQSRNISFVNHKKNYYRNLISFGATTGLDITDVQSEKDSVDVIGIPKELEKNKKYFATTGDYNHSHAPFVMHSSSLTNGYASILAADFELSGVTIIGHHDDVILKTNEVPLQGPFPERFVGGSPYRHADLNRYSELKAGTNNIDSQTDRIEGYKLDISAGKITVRHQDADQPRSSFFRDGTAKRPFNIKNIKQATGSVTNKVSGTINAAIGNFSKVYEVVNAGDRATNNNAFTKQAGFGSASVASAHISDLNDYTRPVHARVEHTFVERFSAPGGPEVAGNADGGPFLDLESGQYSPYNDMNTRNWGVRKPLRDLLTERSERFGIRSGSSEVEADYDVAASFHKTNRNPRTRYEYTAHGSVLEEHTATSASIETVVSYDNWYVQHPIPRSDLQYSWITGSHTSSYIFGHAAKDGLYSGSSEGIVPAITFQSSSEYPLDDIQIDFVGLNTQIVDPVSSSIARIGHVAGTSDVDYKNTDISALNNNAHILNGLLLHRGGVYGYSSWRPLRNSYSPIVRKWNSENTMAFNSEPGELIITNVPKYEAKRSRFGSLQTFTEPPVTSRNFPLKLILDINTVQGTKIAKVESVFGNEVENFTNPSLDKTLDMYQNDGIAYNKVKDLYLNGALGSDSSPVDGFRSLTYKQTVYPKAQNAYLLKTRERPDYTNNFWRGIRSDRDALGDGKFDSYGVLTGTYGGWNMDADSDFSSAITGTTAGIMQNNITHVHNSIKSNITASCVYGWTHTVESSASVVSRTGLAALASDSADTSTTSHPIGRIKIGGGNALWQAYSQAAYNDLTGTTVSAPSSPWHDSYDDFVSEMRAHNKDYSVIPEFRISEHVENIVKNRDGDFFSHIPAFLSIEGAASSHPKNSSESDFYKVYTNSDFMKQFDVIREDHRELVEPSKIKLTCKAIKRFIPYNGFYPSELLPELYLAFSSSYADYASFSGADSTYEHARIRPFITPMFAPGIWNNMIKAGMAVDFPVHTGSFDVQRVSNVNNAGLSYYLMSTASNGDGSATGSMLRIPFEATVEPEKYFSSVPLVDMCVHPSSSMDITSSWGGSGDDVYKMRAHNALASIIEFFLPGKNNKGELEELSSAPEDNWKRFEAGKKYGMAVKVRKSYDRARQAKQLETNKYPTPHDTQLDIDSGLKQTITMYSMPSTWGPPTSGRAGAYGSSPTHEVHGSKHTGALDSLTGVNPAWSPVYSEGECWAHFIYDHSGIEQPSLENLFSSGTLIPWRFDHRALSGSNGGSNQQPYGPTRINDIAMQLTSSFNLFGKRRNSTTETGPAGTIISNTTNTSHATNTWVISPKMTTPILNFNEAAASIPTNGSESVPRGMWHQFGRIPTGSEGIYLEVGDIDSQWIKNRLPLVIQDLTGDADIVCADSEDIGGRSYGNLVDFYGNGNTKIHSLTDQVGFKKKSKKLGTLAKSRIVKEAIVAVPFLERSGKREFFEISEKEVAASLSLPPNKEEKTNSVADMVSKMKEYVLPPRFDFVKYPDKVTPFAMYIFEFKHKFDQDDLSYIWQGLQPRSAASMQLSEASIEHQLLSEELMGKYGEETGEPMPSELQWMVFKVKQKAATDYYEKVVGRQSAPTNTPGTSANESLDYDYSYNWPYDYFSLIEFAKIDAEVKFAPTKSDVIKGPIDCPPTEVATAIENLITQTINKDSQK
jgi:hypothetical protein